MYKSINTDPTNKKYQSLICFNDFVCIQFQYLTRTKLLLLFKLILKCKDKLLYKLQLEANYQS